MKEAFDFGNLNAQKKKIKMKHESIQMVRKFSSKIWRIDTITFLNHKIYEAIIRNFHNFHFISASSNFFWNSHFIFFIIITFWMNDRRGCWIFIWLTFEIIKTLIVYVWTNFLNYELSKWHLKIFVKFNGFIIFEFHFVLQNYITGFGDKLLFKNQTTKRSWFNAKSYNSFLNVRF